MDRWSALAQKFTTLYRIHTKRIVTVFKGKITCVLRVFSKTLFQPRGPGQDGMFWCGFVW